MRARLQNESMIGCGDEGLSSSEREDRNLLRNDCWEWDMIATRAVGEALDRKRRPWGRMSRLREKEKEKDEREMSPSTWSERRAETADRERTSS